MNNLAPSQRQEWVGTTILYQRKQTTRSCFGLFKKTVYGSTHQGKVTNATAKAIAFQLAPSFNFFTGQPTDDVNEAWVSLDEIHILDVLPPR